LQDVRNGRGAGARVPVVISHIREQTGDASALLFLEEDVTVIAVHGLTAEKNHRYAQCPEVAACYDSGRVCCPTPQIATSHDKSIPRAMDFFKPEREAADLGGRDALRLEILSKRHRLILTDVFSYKTAGG